MSEDDKALLSRAVVVTFILAFWVGFFVGHYL